MKIPEVEIRWITISWAWPTLPTQKLWWQLCPNLLYIITAGQLVTFNSNISLFWNINTWKSVVEFSEMYWKMTLDVALKPYSFKHKDTDVFIYVIWNIMNVHIKYKHWYI